MKPNRDLCIMACVFCKEPLFQEWAAIQGGVIKCEPGAKAFILQTCGVASRNDLDRNPTAAELFHERIRKPYLAWKEGQHGA